MAAEEIDLMERSAAGRQDGDEALEEMAAEERRDGGFMIRAEELKKRMVQGAQALEREAK